MMSGMLLKDGEITLADDGAPRTFEFQLLPPVLKNCAACAHSNFCVVLQTLYHLDIEKQLKNVLEAQHAMLCTISHLQVMGSHPGKVWAAWPC